jgi:hypothetical protein
MECQDILLVKYLKIGFCNNFAHLFVESYSLKFFEFAALQSHDYIVGDSGEDWSPFLSVRSFGDCFLSACFQDRSVLFLSAF